MKKHVRPTLLLAYPVVLSQLGHVSVGVCDNRDGGPPGRAAAGRRQPGRQRHDVAAGARAGHQHGQPAARGHRPRPPRRPRAGARLLVGAVWLNSLVGLALGFREWAEGLGLTRQAMYLSVAGNVPERPAGLRPDIRAFRRARPGHDGGSLGLANCASANGGGHGAVCAAHAGAAPLPAHRGPAVAAPRAAPSCAGSWCWACPLAGKWRRTRWPSTWRRSRTWRPAALRRRPPSGVGNLRGAGDAAGARQAGLAAYWLAFAFMGAMGGLLLGPAAHYSAALRGRCGGGRPGRHAAGRGGGLPGVGWLAGGRAGGPARTRRRESAFPGGAAGLLGAGPAARLLAGLRAATGSYGIWLGLLAGLTTVAVVLLVRFLRLSGRPGTTPARPWRAAARRGGGDHATAAAGVASAAPPQPVATP
ncbi:hypothetical protein MRB53_041976 [Persea americana]|nr:hypothetical protein MRB53_041976 [Persea americana]